MRDWHHFIDTRANLNDKQALRYAIGSMLGASVASLLQLYFKLSPSIFLMFVVSSAIFVFFSYGNTLIRQTLMILTGVLLGGIICFFAGLVADWPVWALIYLMVITFILYLYSTINMGCFFFTKFNLILLAFVLLGFPESSMRFYLKVILAIFSGGMLAIVVNTLLYLLGNKAPWKIYIRRWQKDIIQLVNKLAALHYVQSADHLIHSINQIKSYFLSKNPEFFLTMDRTTHSLVKWLKEVNSNTYTFNIFTQEYSQYFQTISKGLANRDAKQILKADIDFTAAMKRRREKRFFTSFPFSVRVSFSESFFLLNKFSHSLADCVAIKEKQHDNQPKKSSSLFQQAFKAFISIRLFKAPWNLTVSGKIALRAAITMGTSYIVAWIYLREYAAWVVLTANLVIQVRKGDTIKKCMDRIFGHLVGAAAVLFIAFYIWPSFNTPFFWTPILIALAAYYFLKNYFIYGIFLMIILVYLYVDISSTGLSNFPIMHFTLLRLLDVNIGSIIALLAGLFIFPNIGLEPIFQPLAHLFEKCGRYLLKLKINSHTTSVSEVLQERHQLVGCLLDNEQLFKTLSFQPDRYDPHRNSQRWILNKQSQLIEHIEALTRRMYNTDNEFICMSNLSQRINLYLNKLNQHLLYYADHVRSEFKRDKVDFRCFIDPRGYDLSIDLEKAIEASFSLSDNKKITYESLISYLGVIHSIREINRLLTASG